MNPKNHDPLGTLDVHHPFTPLHAESPSDRQANGIDGHTADTRLSWPRCYPHYHTCPYHTRRECSIHKACHVALTTLLRAPLSLKHYQQLNIASQAPVKP